MYARLFAFCVSFLKLLLRDWDIANGVPKTRTHLWLGLVNFTNDMKSKSNKLQPMTNTHGMHHCDKPFNLLNRYDPCGVKSQTQGSRKNVCLTEILWKTPPD